MENEEIETMMRIDAWFQEDDDDWETSHQMPCLRWHYLKL